MSKDKEGKTAAILAAGGLGLRFNNNASVDKPKQFLHLLDRPLFIWALSVLCKHPALDKIVVVVLKSMIEDLKPEIEKYLPGHIKRLSLIPGGKSRQESVYYALESLAEFPPDYVVIHDAARPFVRSRDVSSVLAKLAEADGATLAMSVSDSLKKVEQDRIIETVDRSQFYTVQTPQAAHFSELLAGHRLARKKKIATTDDTSILEIMNKRVCLVPGTWTNLKITSQDDFKLAELIGKVLDKFN